MTHIYEPAFPGTEGNGLNHGCPGLTARQYAAIHLRVPDSGEPWLDAMIKRSRHADLVAAALQGEFAAQSEGSGFYETFKTLGSKCHAAADAIMKEPK